MIFLFSDDLLMSFLTADSLWNQLLIYNESKLLTGWVNLHYGQPASCNINENLQKLFKIFPVTDQMIQELYRSDVSTKTRDNISNALCQFGIFCKEERNNLNSLLRRCVHSGNIRYFHEILEKNTSNVTTEDFLNLLTPFCIDAKLFTVLNACLQHFRLPEGLKEKYVDVELISDCRELEIHCTKDTLRNNIHKISKYLSNGDLERYFSENPLIFLALILLTDNVDFVEVIETEKVSIFEQTFTTSVSDMLRSYEMIKLIHNRKSIVRNCDLTYYDILEKHLNLDVRRCFAHHFENKPFPQFGDRNLIERYGYTKQINHIFYVREQRPGIACKYFLIDQYRQFGCIPEESVRVVKKKIYKLAMKNFNVEEIGGSCVAFLEMIGISSEFVRVSIAAATILWDAGRDFETIVEMFLNITNDPCTVLKAVEDQVNFTILLLLANEPFHILLPKYKT